RRRDAAPAAGHRRPGDRRRADHDGRDPTRLAGAPRRPAQLPSAARAGGSMTPSFDPVLLSVLSNAFDGIVREMTNGLPRSARSSVINTARDFSCSVLTADNELLASAEGCPVHVFGSEPLGVAMRELHEDLAPGDAFLHNDPYRGNSHAADHAILVPIFVA